MARSTHATKRAILAFLERTGAASPLMIAEGLGDEWAGEAKRALLRQMIGRMTREGLLIQVRRGRYQASPSWRMFGIDWYAYVEDAVVTFLREVGGRAPTRKIHEAVFARGKLGEAPRTFEYRLVCDVLRTSRLLRRPVRGAWELVSAPSI